MARHTPCGCTNAPFLAKSINPEVAEMKDINCREFAILAILAVAVLGMGVYPEPFVAVVQQAAQDLIAQVAQSKI